MIDLILNNKEWLFSGIGVTVLGILYILLRFLGDRFVLIIKPPFDTSIYKTKPYPSKIRREISKCPPFQREAKRSSYLGIHFQWRTRLEAIHGQPEGTIQLMMLDRGNYPWVYCSVNISEFPELKVAKKGTRLWIAGKLKGIDAAGGQFTLSAEKIKI
ncbi:MAG: hypothetical protein U5J62_06650 [Desulfurivibrio sp.]|nr:hypothetical protein [Desulfurivibrio sp.]